MHIYTPWGMCVCSMKAIRFRRYCPETHGRMVRHGDDNISFQISDHIGNKSTDANDIPRNYLKSIMASKSKVKK